MTKTSIRTLFWDVGGVLLTNGWDRLQRDAAAEQFGLDLGDFDYRHHALAADFETGRISIDSYLDAVVFCRPQDFTRDEFLAFMLEQSQPHDGTLALARGLSELGVYQMATLNNESAYLNEHRIRTFALDSTFELFFSSCYVGMMKPNRRIFELAVSVTRRSAAECLFIDDRASNVEAAQKAGLHAIQHDGNAANLADALREYGVDLASA